MLNIKILVNSFENNFWNWILASKPKLLADFILGKIWLSKKTVNEIIFDPQQFAAEDEGRTEDPTEKRIREAREKGQVAKTQELGQALIVLTGFFVFYLLSGWMLYEIIKLIERFYTDFWSYRFNEIELREGFFFTLYLMAKLLAPIFAITVLTAIISNVVQVGFLFTLKPLAFNFSKIKLDPASMFKKVFFSKQVGMNLLKALFKVVVVGYLCYAIIMSDLESLLKTTELSPAQALAVISFTAFKLIMWVSILLLIISLPDFYFQKSELTESLKMTKHEVKQEYKEQEGDQYIKARLRARREEMLRNKMISEIPSADVVITNPTHIAIALRYLPGSRTPEVIAKGTDYLAKKIKEIAREHDITIIENRYLARELYYRVDIGSQIPAELWRVVAEIYGLLIRQNPERFAHLRSVS